MVQLTKRKEIVFLYDVVNNNPNGDPDDENRPRLDEETNQIRVTDVRLKRTIRDYLSDFAKALVFVKEYREDDHTLKDKETILADYNVNSPNELLEKFIDVRLFGSTTAVKKKTITLTGPVQFKMGITLHECVVENIKGHTVFSSGKGKEGKDKKQGTFTEKWITPYALINFYGLVNENAAKTTFLAAEDIDKMLEAMWKGTKILSSGSKIGHMPRLLMEVTYKEGQNFHIGDLEKGIVLKSQKEGIQIRSTQDFILDMSTLNAKLEKNQSMIESVRLKIDSDIKIENLNFKTQTFSF